LALFDSSSVNGWGLRRLPAGVVRAALGPDEAGFPLRSLGRLFHAVYRLRPDVTLVPSYWHWSLLINLATRLARGRVVMMNDSHAGTSKAGGLVRIGKQRLVSSFHAALVGGRCHKRHFTALGLKPEVIFTGYDAIDNGYFARRVAEIRNRDLEVRTAYKLPRNYFLGLGRLVPKKNFETLIRAYKHYLRSTGYQGAHLVLVGSGVEEPKLHALCTELKLPVYDRTGRGPRTGDNGYEVPGVHFHGFRQIDENPVFYALARAFVLPSLYEEWGLVVNEAMASGLPVIVSETAGCAEDLLETRCAADRFSAATEHRLAAARLATRARRNGFVFDPACGAELGRILALIDTRPELRTIMGANSRRIVEKFSCDNFARNALLAARAALA
jgi:glycosyltransferase involved in cell wall biosynthesis